MWWGGGNYSVDTDHLVTVVLGVVSPKTGTESAPETQCKSMS